MSILFTKDDVLNLEGNSAVRKLPVNRPVFIRLSDGRGVTAKIISISAVGIGILFQAPGQVGAQLDVRFLLPVYRRLFEVKAKARVVHTHLRNNLYYSTLEFIDIDNDDLHVVESFIEEKSVYFPLVA